MIGKREVEVFLRSHRKKDLELLIASCTSVMLSTSSTDLNRDGEVLKSSQVGQVAEEGHGHQRCKADGVKRCHRSPFSLTLSVNSS